MTETADVYDVYYSDGSYYMVYDFTAYRGYYFNSKAPNTYFRNRIYGNAYNTGKNYVGEGWILKDKLDYVTCW